MKEVVAHVLSQKEERIPFVIAALAANRDVRNKLVHRMEPDASPLSMLWSFNAIRDALIFLDPS